MDYVTLWPSWLGESEIEKLDQVSIKSWKKFNRLIVNLDNVYGLYTSDDLARRLIPISDIHLRLSGYRDSQKKVSRDFSTFVIPELDVILEEHWDYTWLLRYRDETALEAVSKYVKSAGLYHFSSHVMKTKRKNVYTGRMSGLISLL